MKISSHNEWDPLKICMVGSATGANFPQQDLVFAAHKKVTKWHESQMPLGPISPTIIDEANEDLEVLCDVMRNLGIQVLRPLAHDFSEIEHTPNWSSDGYMNYCPRDVLLVVGDKVIECPMSMRSRTNEARHYAHVKEKHLSNCNPWIICDRPLLLDHDFCIDESRVVLSEREPIFDAANVLRLDDDILYLVSSSGNRAGASWLQNILGAKYRVHVLEDLYASTHIDTTITVIRPGLVLLNGDRVNDRNCPKIFDTWEKIYVQDVVPGPFYQYPYGSKWMALNMLSVSPDTVICDALQTQLIKTLENKGITVIPLMLRHSRTLGGGFHCVTLDLLREK